MPSYIRNVIFYISKTASLNWKLLYIDRNFARISLIDVTKGIVLGIINFHVALMVYVLISSRIVVCDTL